MHKQAKVVNQPEGAVTFTMVQHIFTRNPFGEFRVREQKISHMISQCEFTTLTNRKLHDCTDTI